jgi:hypothetical protein
MNLQEALINARRKQGMCCCAAGCADSPYADGGYWRGQFCGCWCHLEQYEKAAAALAAREAAK